MSKFLKLTNIIINTDVIQHINIKKNKFIIHLMTNKTDGFIIFGGGASHSYNTEFDVCKTENLSDYTKVADWISKAK